MNKDPLRSCECDAAARVNELKATRESPDERQINADGIVSNVSEKKTQPVYNSSSSQKTEPERWKHFVNTINRTVASQLAANAKGKHFVSFFHEKKRNICMYK